MEDKKHLDTVLKFIREHRSNESNFDKLYTQLQDLTARTQSAQYKAQLEEIKEKQGEAYRQGKKLGTTAWPEFENFVAEFEKVISQMLKEE